MKNTLRIGMQRVAFVFCTLIVFTPFSVVFSQCDTVLALTCDAAPLIPLDDYCGRTNDVFALCCNGWCGNNTSVHNPTYHEFVATDDSVRIEVRVLPCSEGLGLQAAILPSCPWDNSDILDCDPGTPPGGIMDLSATGLIIGEHYWLLVDGSSGAMCNFLIEHVHGAFQPNTPIIFLQSSGTTLSATAGSSLYTYSWFDCEENEVIGTDSIFEAPGPGCYCVTVRDSVYASTFCTTVTATAYEDVEEMVIAIHPNPSNSYVEINVTDQEAEQLTLSIFDSQGRRIKESPIDGGRYLHSWEHAQAAGVYLFVIASDGRVFTRQRIVYTGRF